MNSQNVTTDALTTMNENKLLRLGRRPDFFSPDFKHIREVDENNVAKSGSNRIVSNTPRNVLGDKTNEMLWSQKRPKRTLSAIETRRKSQKIAKTRCKTVSASPEEHNTLTKYPYSHGWGID